MANTNCGGSEDRGAKRDLRAALRQRIAKGGGDSAAVCEVVVKFLEERPELRTVALFAAMRGEVDLSPLLAMDGRVFVFPKVEEGELGFFEVSGLADLEKGSYKIDEPRASLPRVAVEEIDLFLCPGLGFDARGGRIGRGKGFYDKALLSVRKGAVKAGVGFAFQLVDRIPMEDFDVRMDAVIVA